MNILFVYSVNKDQSKTLLYVYKYGTKALVDVLKTKTNFAY
jgi:hypothetical protein